MNLDRDKVIAYLLGEIKFQQNAIKKAENQLEKIDDCPEEYQEIENSIIESEFGIILYDCMIGQIETGKFDPTAVEDENHLERSQEKREG